MPITGTLSNNQFMNDTPLLWRERAAQAQSFIFMPNVQKIAKGNYLDSTFTGENNQFIITLNPALPHGERLEARIQRAIGNIGPVTKFTASGSQYPAQPIILTVSDDAGTVTEPLKIAIPRMITVQPSAVLPNQVVPWLSKTT